MALTATIPAVIKDFIPNAERAPKAFAEAWRYTPMAGVDLQASGAVRQTDVPAGQSQTMIEVVAPGHKLEQHTIHVAAGATLNHIRITESTADDVLLLQTEATVEAGGQYHFYTLTTGAKRLRQRVQINLQGQGAAATLAAAYILKGTAHHDLAAHINHHAPNCTSRQHIKGAVRDAARAAFQGKIHVAQAAQETEAYQLHKAMLLSERAEVNAKPELEIYADRVKCSHGNAIGALDEDALFYLQARGIDAMAAQHLLTEAFLLDTLEYAPAGHEMLAERIQNLLRGIDAQS